MIDEPFSSGCSLFHRLDPRIKIVFATIYSFMVAVMTQFDAMAASLVFSLALIAMARLNGQQVARRLTIVNVLNIFFWIVLPLTFEGNPLFQIGTLEITRSGVLLAAQITLKSNAILLAFITMVATSSIAILGHAMNQLRIPDKMVHLLLMTYRYVFVIEQEYQRLLKAVKIRNFRPKTNMHTYRTYAYLVGMLFVRASARAERVHHAMLCRGFKGKFYCLHDFSVSRLDLIWSTSMGVVIIGLGLLEWMITT